MMLQGATGGSCRQMVGDLPGKVTTELRPLSVWARELSRQSEQPVQRHSTATDGTVWGQKECQLSLAQKSEPQERVVEGDKDAETHTGLTNHQKAFGFYLRRTEDPDIFLA